MKIRKSVHCEVWIYEVSTAVNSDGYLKIRMYFFSFHESSPSAKSLYDSWRREEFIGGLLIINGRLIYNTRPSLSEEERGLIPFLVIFCNTVSTVWITWGCCP